MPELAEVALYARDLSKVLKGREVIGVKFHNQADWGSEIFPHKIQKEIRNVKGQTISFQSVGKALWLLAGESFRPIVEFRLGMTGQFHLEPIPGKWKRHCFLEINCEDLVIRYSDPRRFGRILFPIDPTFAIGGYQWSEGLWINPQPIPPKGFLSRPRISWLLGTGSMTGVGNYMANEALGFLKLSPFEPCKNESEAVLLLKTCAKIAKKSYLVGGNSFGSGYFNIYGNEGHFSKLCRFYKNPSIPRHVYQGRPIYTNFKFKKN